AELDRALRSDPQLRSRPLDEPAAREALRTGKVDLVVLPGPPISYLYDPARPESRLARALADAALQPPGSPAPIDKPVTGPGARRRSRGSACSSPRGRRIRRRSAGSSTW